MINLVKIPVLWNITHGEFLTTATANLWKMAVPWWIWAVDFKLFCIVHKEEADTHNALWPSFLLFFLWVGWRGRGFDLQYGFCSQSNIWTYLWDFHYSIYLSWSNTDINTLFVHSRRFHLVINKFKPEYVIC